MNRMMKVGAAVVLAVALTGCGKALKEENARLMEQVTQLTELNTTLQTEKGNLEVQVSDLSNKVVGLEAQLTDLNDKLAAKIKARPVPRKKG